MSFHMDRVRWLGTALALVAGAAAALDLSLEASVEYRAFAHAPLDDEQHRQDGSLALEPEAYVGWDDRDQSVTLRVFGRLDRFDDRRTHADIREAFYRYTSRNFEWRLGVRREFWGVLEAAHLVDVINQTDFVEDIAGEAKLGQPMANLAWFTPVGTVDFYVMPVFRERTFPGEEGRPRPLLPVAESAARTNDSGLDVAIRYFETFGGVDAGLYYFHGTNREPRFTTVFDACDVTVRFNPVVGLPLLDPLTLSCAEARSVDAGAVPPELVRDVRVAIDEPRLAPVYDRMDQFGADLQYVTGGLALKLETFYRRAHAYDVFAIGGGLEYTLYNLFDSGYDVGLLAEYYYDDRGLLERDVGEAADRLSRSGEFTFDSIAAARAFERTSRETQNAATFQDDLFLGTRLAFNDLAGSEILAGISRDLDTGALFANVEASRRLFGAYRAAMIVRAFADVPVSDPLYGFRDDDYLALTLTRFF